MFFERAYSDTCWNVLHVQGHALQSKVQRASNCRKVSCLENLTSAELNLLSHSMGVRRLKPGEVVYKAGDPGDRLYIVQRGTVIETAHDKKGDQVILVKGSSFGEDALLSNEPRMSTMVAGPNEPPATTGGLPIFSRPLDLFSCCLRKDCLKMSFF